MRRERSYALRFPLPRCYTYRMQHHGFSGTIASYPDRGIGGKSSYRGNCSPRFVSDYLCSFNPAKGLTIDPMEGSGTTGDVCKELGIPYKGFDLRNGFDARRMRIRDQIENPAAAAFLHPAYAGMVRYSRDVWGQGADIEGDLSARGTDVDGFCGDLQEVLYNVFDSLAVGGTYALLLGLWRHPETKELLHLPARIFPYCPGSFVNEIIKAQHNTQSGRSDYGHRPFVLTTHEVAYVFRKTANSLVGSVLHSLGVADELQRTTWRTLVRSFAMRAKRFTTESVLAALTNHPAVQKNQHRREKIRQQLGALVAEGVLQRTAPGEYLVAA